MSNPEKTVAIIGGGPVGLAAAAHALSRGLKPIVLEAGDKVGQAVHQWSHVRMFSSWSHNVDKAAVALLRAEGWNSPEPDRYPTGGEFVAQYLEPLATRTKLSQHIQTNARVISVGRVGFDKVKTGGRENAPFEIRYQNGKGPSTLHADAVIDASGTWETPNPAGVNGLERSAKQPTSSASPTACLMSSAASTPATRKGRCRHRRRPLRRGHHSRPGAAQEG